MKTLLYAPLVYNYDVGMRGLCPDTWYFEWHKKLYNFLDGREDVNVIWKAPKNGSHIIDPIRHFKSDNIRYSTRSLKKELKKTDIAFIDYPSTPLLDCVKARVPVLCITMKAEKYIRDYYLDNRIVIYEEDQDKILLMLNDYIWGQYYPTWELTINRGGKL